ncbi:MAG: MFS transporter [Oscillospiraceae bacterium]|jgi:MFS family permease|nr:MFS transporter [Oscillospiraceae bacterium]
MGIKGNYNHTLYASYIGYVVQAITNNFTPLLFLTFQDTYSIPLGTITLLITANFCTHLAVYLAFMRHAEKIGYRRLIVFSHLCAAAGLAGLAVLPGLFPDPYAGLACSTFLFAMGGGLNGMLLTPIAAACPFGKDTGRISLLHSFYCWGHVFVILASTLFFVLFGIGNWKILALLWALAPLANAVYFTRVPIGKIVKEDERIPVRKLFSFRLFWLFVLLMVCAGAAEQAMSQWVSAFTESSLRVSKTLGDIAGTCMFAVGMGVPRVIYGRYGGKMDLRKCMIGGAVLCILCYLAAAFSPYPVLALVSCVLCGFSVGIFWPGTFSLASGEFIKSGTAVFACMAFAGDIGCSLGPAVVGAVTRQAGNGFRAGMSAAVVFPAALIVSLILYQLHLRNKNKIRS